MEVLFCKMREGTGPMEKIALLTVGMAHHAPYLRLSRRLLAEDLKGTRWILIDNSPEKALKGIAEEHGFEWIEGPAAPEPRADFPPHAIGSLHHARGLRRGIDAVTSRYLLIIDPDFLLLIRNAVGALLDKMRRDSLAALGVPWTPELHYKWRGAPCLHCLLLDLEQVPREALRLEPGNRLGANDTASRYTRLAQLLRPARSLLSPLHQLTTGRIGVGHSRDTGFALAQWLKQHKPERIGLLPAAVFDRQRFSHPWHLRHGWGWALEQHLPQRWSYLPSSDHYRLSEGEDLSDIAELGLDIFYLEEHILAVHVRRSRALFAGAWDEAAYIERLSAALERRKTQCPPRRAVR
jgi:hypothetical protein